MKQCEIKTMRDVGSTSCASVTCESDTPIVVRKECAGRWQWHIEIAGAPATFDETVSMRVVQNGIDSQPSMVRVVSVPLPDPPVIVPEPGGSALLIAGVMMLLVVKKYERVRMRTNETF